MTFLAQLPRATYDDETTRTTCSDQEMFSLPLGRIPLSASFGIFQSFVTALFLSWVSPLTSGRTHLLPDPTSFETPLLPTILTIALDENDRGCLVRHEGLGGIAGMSGEQVIGEAWGMAEERIRELLKLLPGS